MKRKDAAVIKVLSDIGATEEPELTPAQEFQLKRALDPEEQFLHDVEKLYVKEDSWDDEDTRRKTPNPLPVAGSAELKRVFDMAEDLDDKILADAKRRGIRPNGLREIGALLKQGRMAYGNMESVPLSKVIASEDMLDGKHLKALVNHKATTAASGDVTLLKVGDKYYAQDGNHRMAAAFLRGEKEINALVLDVGSN
jgi:hypothetical protein